LLTAFFIIIYRPLKQILRFIFYKIIVRVYSYYLSFVKKIGWDKMGESIFLFLFNQKFVHVLIILLTVIVSFTNLIQRTKANDIMDDSRDTILSHMVVSEFGEVEDEDFYGEYIEEESIVIPSVQKYIENSNVVNNKTHIVTNNDEILNNDEFSINSEGTAVIKSEISTTQKTVRPRTEMVYYDVQSGDTISTIAQDFGVSVNTILWENNLSIYSLIRPGKKLAILPTTGVKHKVIRGENIKQIANKYKVDEERIIEVNNIANANKLAIGDMLIIPDGKKFTTTSYSPTRVSSVSAITNLVKPSAAAPVASNKMNWPTSGYRITQYYSWRHTGLDIADKAGTSIYAADAGTVEYAGWSNGYGNNIVVNHGGGKKTRYAHLSKFYVSKGVRVDKGETIAAMGNTGWSTGPHLHFEVIINGSKYNPLNYIR
jgi:murein DD-endopeptidase MepM/ murein hydrolase activator NlpD